MTLAPGSLHVFAGPTLTPDRVHALAPGAVIHPPVKHGNLLRLGPEPGDTVLIIDGLWHQVPPVRHKEILELLHHGVTVTGAASMGALRAAELAPYGMIGIGWVYEQYATGHIDADDEVALVHTPEGAPLSTALVCLRYALAQAAAAGVLTPGEAEQLLAAAVAMPFPRRSWTALSHGAAASGLTGACDRLLAWRAGAPAAVADIKAADAQLALRLIAAGELPGVSPTGEWGGRPWRTSHLRRWAATYRPVIEVDGAQVPLLPALQHAQLYDPSFPARWRQRVLSWIAGLGPGVGLAAYVEEQALHAAHDRGLRLGSLTPAQVEHWASPAEITGLCQRELLLRILVRSARLDPTASIWPETPSEAEGLFDLDTSAQAAAAAWRTNREIAATGPGRTTDHLDPDRIRAHLADRWGLAVPVDSAELTAAARDRGILGEDAAISQTRPFYLEARATAAA